MIKKLKYIINHLLVGGTRYFDIRGFWIRAEMEKMQHLSKYSNPLNLIPFGKKMYSQNDEDGIIIEIFNRIGSTNKILLNSDAATEQKIIPMLYYSKLEGSLD